MNIIAGYQLTCAEERILKRIRAALPKDGREIPLLSIFPLREDRGGAKRQVATRLASLGILAASGIDWQDGYLRQNGAVPKVKRSFA
jgi:hypothetical protein